MCVSVSQSVTNRALISPVFAGRSSPNSGRGWIHIWDPRFQELDRVRRGAGRAGSQERKKPWVFFCKNFELEYLARLLADRRQTWCASRYPGGRQAHLTARRWLAPRARRGRLKIRPPKYLILNISGVYEPISMKRGLWVHLRVLFHHSESRAHTAECSPFTGENLFSAPKIVTLWPFLSPGFTGSRLT